MKRRVLIAAGAALGVGLVWCLLWGPLIALSPWKPGFAHLRLERADVYYPQGWTLPAAYSELDRHIAAGEAYLQLRAERRITVFLTRDWSEFRRFMPQMRGSGVGAVTLATGTVIYVSPKLEERRLDHGEFLRHELAHALMHQHQSVWNAVKIGPVSWLSEGVPVSFGDQKAYLTPQEFRRRAQTEDVVGVLDPDSGKPLTDMKYAYVAWRQFVEYLIREEGRDRFQTYLEKVMARPGEWRQLFSQVYGIGFGDYAAGFVRHLREATPTPQ